MRVVPGPWDALNSLIMALALLLPALAAAEPLTLAGAERIALERDTGVAAARAESESLRATGVAARQLPDPEARFGAVSVPVDSWALDREDMTMVEVGVVQRFPAGHSREYAGRKYDRLATGRDAEAEDRARMALREVRTAWFELTYLDRAEAVAREQARWLEALVASATAAYAAGAGTQADLLAARLEALDLRERLLMYARERAMRRAELIRFVGEPADGELALGFAAEMPPEPLADLERRLPAHPRLQMRQAEAHAAGDDAAMARERYKPAWGIDLSYGFRQGAGMDGVPRADLASAMLMFEVPLFKRDRQDREVAAARSMQRAVERQQEGEARALAAELASAHGRAVQLGELVRLYRDDGAKLAAISIDSALAAFRSGGGEFMNVVSMQGRAFTVRERQARAEADLSIVRAELDYLAGSQP